MNKLVFAQKFPFSNIAREVVRDSGVGIESVGDEVKKKAAFFVTKAFNKENYSLDLVNPSSSLLQIDVLAFPIAKLFVSSMRTPKMVENFSFFVFKNTLKNLLESEDSFRVSLELANDFGLRYELVEEKNVVKIGLIDYLGINFVDNESKLVNKQVSEGSVFLNSNDFARFLAEKAFVKVFSSLPIPLKDIPKSILIQSKTFDSQLIVIEKKNFDLKLVGRIEPSFFSPCMLSLYNDQLAGKKLSYYARLSLASFLFQLGMSKNELITLFSKSPDFKKQVLEYHVNRIFEKGLSAPGCKKMWEYGLKVNECEKECKFKHPVQYYVSKLRVSNRIKNKKKELRGFGEER